MKYLSGEKVCICVAEVLRSQGIQQIGSGNANPQMATFAEVGGKSNKLFRSANLQICVLQNKK